MRKIKVILLNLTLKYLFPSVMENSVLKEVGGVMYVGGEKMTDHDIANLTSECLFLKESRLWDVFMNTVKSQAREVMFERSKSFDDMLSGKLMLYNLDVLDSIVRRFAGKKRHTPIGEKEPIVV
jgi:hypothetical protein